MTALLNAELIKLRTTRTFAALAGAAVATSLLLAVLVSLLTEPTEDGVLVDVFASDTSGLFILVLAVVGIGGEWRHRTITSSLLAAPDRLRFLLAKTLAFAAAGLVLSVLISVAVTIAGVAILSVRDLPLPDAGELVAQYARNALIAVLFGAFGVGIGALVRNQVVAIVGLLVAMFVVEPLVLAVAEDVGRWAPLGPLSTALSDIPPEDAGMGDVSLPSPAAAALALLGWIAATVAAAAALLRRRDLN